MKNFNLKMNILITLNLLLILSLGLIGFYNIYKDKENKKVDNNLLYSIKKSNLNCEQVILNIFKDNTYEYIYEYDEFNNKYSKLKGTFNYQIDDIIQNNEESSNINYLVTDNLGNTYKIDESNIYLQEFLEEININLDNCLKIIN